MSIEARGITKRFGDFVALDDVDLTVAIGQLTALLGPSGGGKSTLLRIIGGLEEPDTGTVEIDGEDATGVPAQRRNVGFVFQHYAAFKHLTVVSQRRLRPGDPQAAQGRDPQAGRRTARAGAPRAVRRPAARRSCPAASASAWRWPGRWPSSRGCCCSDEPFGALDAKVRKELRDWLRRLHDEVHVTTVFVTHDQEEALEVSDEIVVINHGRIEQVGTPDELYDQPANDFVMGFLGPVTRLDGRLVRPHDIEMFTAPVEGAVAGDGHRLQRIGFEVRAELQRRRRAAVGAADPRPGRRRLDLARGSEPVWPRSAARLDAA